MHPTLFTLHNLPWIGDLPIRSFGVMVMLGVIAGSWWLSRALRAIGVERKEAASDLVTLSLLTGFLLARWTYLAIHPEAWHGPISLVAVWEGGIVSFGGFVGGAVGALWFARRRHIPFLRLGDAMLPALFLGQTFGRIGCFLVGDDYGRPWSGPWAVSFPKLPGGLIPDDLVGVPLHPAQLYLSVMSLMIFLITAAIFRRRKYDGQVLTATMVLFAVGRFLLEYTRGDDAARGIYGPLSAAQWAAMVILLAALLIRAGLPLSAPSSQAPQPESNGSSAA